MDEIAPEVDARDLERNLGQLSLIWGYLGDLISKLSDSRAVRSRF